MQFNLIPADFESFTFTSKFAEPVGLAVITDDNWTEATPARRERYINERRRADPATARALVEAVWASETADMRLRLLGPLSVRLGPDDRAFLEGLAKDRAPKV